VRLDGAAVLVTGASGGIGAATAELLTRRGARVLLAGRDAAALGEVGRRCRAPSVIADLRRPGAADDLVGEVTARFGRLDAVVAAAGIGHAGPVAGMSAQRVADLVDVNARAPLLLARSALDAFGDRPSDEAALVFVTSIAGLVGVPGESVYSATKAAVEMFAELLREEVRADPALHGVQVSTVAPGAVDTAFFARRGAPYDRRVPRPLPPDRVAAAVVRALESGRPRTVVPAWLRLPARLATTAPDVYRTLARRLS
jgi:short-subunit dehydrogenase